MRSSAANARRAAAPLRLWALALLAVALLTATACYNSTSGETEIKGIAKFKLPAFPGTGSHAVEVFTEMHFQPSYRSQEIPRILPAPDSVPVTGREIRFATADEYKGLDAPSDVFDAARGRKLFSVNCAVCHGTGGRGDGTIVGFLGSGTARPADLTSAATEGATEGELFMFITFGGRQGAATVMRGLESASIMPFFGSLLTEDERWALVRFIGGLRNGEPPPPPEPTVEAKPPPPCERGDREIAVSAQDPGGSGSYLFDPADLNLCVGDTITFTVTSETEFHTFTVDDLDIDEAVDASGTIRFSFTFDQAGTYELICIPHGTQGMVATITVR
jgi:plastocyanin/mono/diheme cytochrome c family protein